MSLQNISQALITSNDVADLAARICRLTSELCGADRAILYYLGTDDQIVVLATNGWEPDRILKNLVKEQVFLIPGKEIVQFNRWPPGIPPRHPDVEGAELRAGLYVPLFSQDDPVGLMILHSTRKPQALAIQRAALIDQLIAKIAELRAAQAAMLEKERIERELEIARQVQLSILPEKFPEAPGYKIGAKYEPARQVGGDFYDVIALDNDYLGLAIGDVSDKGVPAALYMALTRSLLLAEAQRDHSPKAVLANINHLLLALSQENMFVTLFYGILETKTRILTYSCAGHDRPALIRAGRADLLEGEGRPLGILEGEEFFLSEDTVQLVLDDRLVLYTDGLTDVLMQEGRLSDRKRFLSSLELHANRSPTELCQEVFSDLLAAKGDMDQYDDMAMLVLEVNG
jgi:serine phosphatase RsbU (regulator of sigma subunit)